MRAPTARGAGATGEPSSWTKKQQQKTVLSEKSCIKHTSILSFIRRFSLSTDLVDRDFLGAAHDFSKPLRNGQVAVAEHKALTRCLG